MSSPAPSTSRDAPRSHRAGRSVRILVSVIVAVVVVLAAYATYAAYSQPPATLTIYTYSSLFGGNCGSPALTAAVAPFETAHHVHLRFECPSGTLVSTLLAERNAPGADVVIGLDEVTAYAAAEDGLLVPYAPPDLAHVDPALVHELDPFHRTTPYEWGYLAIDYAPAFANATGDAIAHSSFANFSANTSWSSGLLIEDPTTDIVGEEFLLWEIAFYSGILHQDWTTWWKAVAPHVRTAPDWSTAFGEFTSPPNNPPMVVSFTSDVAYADATGSPGSLGTAVTTWNGSEYGWRTIYGLGIVNGSAHLTLDQEFVDWFLSGTVQSAIPTNEWEYPANDTVGLPSAYNATLDPSVIQPLDETTSPAAIAQNLPGYLEEWQTIENQAG
jgi:thiamine transport system substrate-binding protein